MPYDSITMPRGEPCRSEMTPYVVDGETGAPSCEKTPENRQPTSVEAFVKKACAWENAPETRDGIHTIYGEDAAAFDIRTGALIDGGFPDRAASMVREWISRNREDLLTMWETQEFKKLDPLD